MKKLKKFLAMTLLLASLLTCLPLSSASAAETKAFDELSSSGYARVYTVSASGKTTPYTNQNLNVRGTVTYGANRSSYIDNASDELYLMDVGCTNGRWWAYVQYPSGNRRVSAYIDLSAITANNANHAKTVSSGRFNCALRATSALSGKYYVAAGDTVYLLATGSRYQIMYPTSGGKWRIAWCDKADYKKFCGGEKTNASTNTSSGSQILDGTFVITTALNSNLALDVENNSNSNGANLQLYLRSSGNQAQIFRIVHMGGGWHKIIHVSSGNAIDVAGGVAGDCVNVWLYDASDAGNAAQLWKFVAAPGGGYYIQNKLGYDLNVQNGNASKNANIWTYHRDYTKAGIFHLNALTTASAPSGDSWKMPMTDAKCTWESYTNMSWGSRNGSGSRTYHLGVDIWGGDGSSTVCTAADGEVVKCSSSPDGANGRFVIIKHTLSGKTVYSFYAHLAEVKVAEKDKVSQGDVIAKAGGSGYGREDAYGKHLHFAIMDSLNKNGSYYGYATKFTGDKVNYKGTTFYNPVYVTEYNRLPA